MTEAYKVKRQDNRFYIYETSTEQCIENYRDFRSASLRLVDLKRGEGFQGWTPAFLAKGFTPVDYR